MVTLSNKPQRNCAANNVMNDKNVPVPRGVRSEAVQVGADGAPQGRGRVNASRVRHARETGQDVIITFI